MNNRFEPSEENIKALGRTILRKGIRWCAFSGTGIEFVSRGKDVRIKIYGDSTVTDPDNRARLAIYVDGRRIIDDMIKEKEKEYVIARDARETVHTVRVIKLSESAMSTMGIGEIITESVLPTAQKDFFIEYIGDSITCGYGVDDENPEHHFLTSTEDVTKSFSYVSAGMLDVDYSMVSFSGYGVLSGYTDSGKINSKELLPPHYKKFGFSYATSGTEGDTFKAEDIEWDFSGRKPQMVIINLGTNDSSYTGDNEKLQKQYQEKYIEFVKTVRTQYKDSYILCILGLMGDILYPALSEAVNTYKVENADFKIETMPLVPIIAETEKYVADYHPTKVSHRRAAEALAERVKHIASREFGKVLGLKEVALTFDDGPNTTVTMDVLDVLRENDVKATFFLVGNSINEKSSVSIKRANEQGCEIENHSMTHSAMSEMEEDEFLEEIGQTGKLIGKLTGVYPIFFRPPYIAVNDLMLEKIPLYMIAGYGCDDWKNEITATMRAQKILSQMADARILLLHDAEDNQAAAKTVEIIIKRARALGYGFVRLDKLFENRHVMPLRGVVYNEATAIKKPDENEEKQDEE
ncbi:MAG: polysaccharide deacetylase family protein [Lachnospiraceae bacterium]|nr:polysaccharide deacetylase family protein [Lachnospiraceae bacterium]